MSSLVSFVRAVPGEIVACADTATSHTESTVKCQKVLKDLLSLSAHVLKDNAEVVSIAKGLQVPLGYSIEVMEIGGAVAAFQQARNEFIEGNILKGCSRICLMAGLMANPVIVAVKVGLLTGTVFARNAGVYIPLMFVDMVKIAFIISSSVLSLSAQVYDKIRQNAFYTLSYSDLEKTQQALANWKFEIDRSDDDADTSSDEDADTSIKRFNAISAAAVEQLSADQRACFKEYCVNHAQDTYLDMQHKIEVLKDRHDQLSKTAKAVEDLAKGQLNARYPNKVEQLQPDQWQRLAQHNPSYESHLKSFNTYNLLKSEVKSAEYKWKRAEIEKKHQLVAFVTDIAKVSFLSTLMAAAFVFPGVGPHIAFKVYSLATNLIQWRKGHSDSERLIFDQKIASCDNREIIPLKAAVAAAAG